jgi:ABC-type phosphate transport system substrate-binding protein
VRTHRIPSLIVAGAMLAAGTVLTAGARWRIPSHQTRTTRPRRGRKGQGSMRYGRLSVSLAIAGTVAGMVCMAVQPAYADYAPNAKDVVGVGSDTLQYLVDFAADGDQLGDPGYNSAANKYRLINFDATADANARLAYGPDGAAGVGGNCSPGTGSDVGSVNTTPAETGGTPCILNPTIVLRAGDNPIQRPNGSGAGAKALSADSQINFSRASACQGPATDTILGEPCAGNLSTAYDDIRVGTDPLAILSATTTNAVPLSAEQLKSIYSCTDTTWSSVQAGASGDTIIPIIPTLGSGTRTVFLQFIGLTNATLGSCVVTAEENDPTAIAAQSSPADAIEPMSGGRLNLFQAILGTGGSTGSPGYFRDPSCPINTILAAAADTACANPSGTNPINNVINPAVKLWTSGTPSDGNPLFDENRPLFIYFLNSAVSSTTPWQPGSTLNAIQTLFYNPCPTGATDCVAGTGIDAGLEFGPGGPPYFAQQEAWTDIAAAGVDPEYAVDVPGV